MDESVCHLQDSSCQSSLGGEGAVPVWVGMGWLETKCGEAPIQTAPCQMPVDSTHLRSLTVVHFVGCAKFHPFSTRGSEAVGAQIIAHPHTSCTVF